MVKEANTTSAKTVNLNSKAFKVKKKLLESSIKRILLGRQKHNKLFNENYPLPPNT